MANGINGMPNNDQQNQANGGVTVSKVALPITNMQTTLPIFKGGSDAASSVCPIDIDQMIQAEQDSLSDTEKEFQLRNGTNATPSSFDAAERFINILNNPPAAGMSDQKYNTARDECVGLLTIFACRRLLGINISAETIDMTSNSPSVLLKGLGSQIGRNNDNARVLTYFCIDGKPFAYIYKGRLVPIKDKKLFSQALISVPFFNSSTGQFDDILAATEADADNGKLLFKQLLYAFLFNNGGAQNGNGTVVGYVYSHIMTYIGSRWGTTPYLGIVLIDRIDNAPLRDVLLNAPYSPDLPDKLFSDKLLMLSQSGRYTPPCFSCVVYDFERYNVVNPISEELCKAIVNPDTGVKLVKKNENGIYNTDWEGAPDTSDSDPDTDGFITCKVRLEINGTLITIQRMYSVREDSCSCIFKDKAGTAIDTINMGIDCNYNPIAAIQRIFRRYVVWNCPDCLSVYFDQAYPAFPVTHLNDKAYFAVVEPDQKLPEFAFVKYLNGYCGCIRFPEPVQYRNIHGTSDSSIYLDFGTTNTICLVIYGALGVPNPLHEFVDIKRNVKMVTGDQENADFRIFHLLSDRDSDSIIRSIAICALEENDKNTPLYRAHALNAGKEAITKSIERAEESRTDGNDRKELDLRDVNVYDNLKWTSDVLANEGYCALVCSIFSSAFAMLLGNGYNPQYTKINISIPSSMDAKELKLTTKRLQNALGGIDSQLTVTGKHYESTAAAFYIFNTSTGAGNCLNVGVDIGGGTIDLFSFRSVLGATVPIPAYIDSVKNAAGRAILSSTFVKAAKHFVDKRTGKSLFFDCFTEDSNPPANIVTASDTAALCITETFISEAKFNGTLNTVNKRRLSCFQINVLLRIIAVLNYAVAFVKTSWPKDEDGQDMDFGDKDVIIFLCGNGSSILSEKWTGVNDDDLETIKEFLRSRIGCRSLDIKRSGEPKREAVKGMMYIEEEKAVHDGKSDAESFSSLAVQTTLDGRPQSIARVKEYINELLNEIETRSLLEISTCIDDISDYTDEITAEVTDSSINAAIKYVLTKDIVGAKGDELFMADVFLRLMLELPFIDPYNN